MSKGSGVSMIGGGVIVLAGGAYVASRAVTSLAGSTLIALGDAAERSMAQRRARDHALGVWEIAAREVIGRNARLRHAAHRAAGDSAVLQHLPPPCDVSCLSPEQMWAWCVTADSGLAEAEKSLGAASRRRVDALVADALGRIDLPDVRTTAGESPAERRARTAAEGQQEAVHRVLDVLLPQVTEEELRDLSRSAAALLTDTTTAWNERLRSLRRRVARLNAAVRTRHSDALEAALFLEALDGEPEGGPVVPRLEAVLGGAALDDDLRRVASEQATSVRERHERAYIQRRVVSALEDMGYEVDEDFTTLHGDDGRLRLVKDGWSEHAVGLNVDENGVRSQLIRTREPAGADARAVDLEREREWCSSVEALSDVLGERGMPAEARGIVEPGLSSLPVCRARRPGKPRKERMHRER